MAARKTMGLDQSTGGVRVAGGAPAPLAAVPSVADVKRILVVNAKGGCGKTTVATNLAGYYAQAGLAPAILDFDPQASCTRWLAARTDSRPPVHGVTAFRLPQSGTTRAFQLRIPPGIARVVVDTPAGIAGQGLLDQVKLADVVLVPVLPSPLDIDAAGHFLKELSAIARVRAGSARVGIVANRVRNNTRIFHTLVHFLYGLNLPFVARLRDTQNYIRAATEGLGVCELHQGDTEGDVRQWEGLMEWVEGKG